ncbi:hypothetical protein BH09BAC5_BH09BAC5_17970 [soil metagenome]
MTPKKICFLLSVFLISVFLKAQPFVDVLNFNVQQFQSTYKDSLKRNNSTTDYNLNVFVPKVFKNGNTFLFRVAGEQLISKTDSSSGNLYSLSMPVGFQFLTKSKKWKILVMGIPKIASDLRDNNSKDIQYGGVGLFTWVKSDSLKVKFGLYYNKECFGNFFVPLIGIDWKVTKHINLYGMLPNNMRVEYAFGKKLFAGIGYKNFKRSYRLFNGWNDDFVLVNENQVKVFVEYFVWKKIILFTEIGYSMKYSFIQYDNNKTTTKYEASKENLNNPVYLPMNNNFTFMGGLAYRIRLD